MSDEGCLDYKSFMHKGRHDRFEANMRALRHEKFQVVGDEGCLRVSCMKGLTGHEGLKL